LSSADLTDDELATALRVLARVAEDRASIASFDADTRAKLQQLAGEVARPDIKQRRRLQRELRRRDKRARRAHDEELREATGLRQLRAQPVFVTPTALPPPSSEEAERGRLREDTPELKAPRKCYVCKAEFKRLHHFYDQLCPACGDLNLDKRSPEGDLSGRIALVTGARVKIGYHAAILLLRAGCRVVVTTRFPRDAAARYAREPDFERWRDRLSVYGLDLRHTPSVESLAHHLDEDLPHLDFVLHNACQTVRRPPGFYGHLLEEEQRPVAELPDAHRPLVEGYESLRGQSGRHGLTSPAELTQAQTPADLLLGDEATGALEIFPRGVLDADLQQVDLRSHNSWRLTLAEVPTLELLEVLLVNAVAPFVLSSRLKPLMLRTATRDKHIVNVSAMEGQFYREHKTDKHPHTNMAKAALNMLTRTSAQDYVKDGIHMNSVDTGWVTDEDPAHLADKKVEEHDFSPPLDVVDGAARIVDPIFEGLRTGAHAWGQFFKDYRAVPW
jgi:NAD(P)-dependent dehydrogenase (short-subunit alcohol dehydrogenase family)